MYKVDNCWFLVFIKKTIQDNERCENDKCLYWKMV